MMATAAPVGDVVQWLNNRLGNAEKTWVDDSSIAPYLTKELLEGILDCFLDLQTHIKIKLLLSFLHIVRRTVETLRSELESVIDLAVKDPDPWVSLTAELIRHFPSKGEFNVMVHSPMFNGMRNDVMKHLKRLSERTRELQLVPYEAHFMNKKAFAATYGTAAAPVKHLTLKQKPKSATLRADALLRANEAKPKNLANPSLPIRFKDQIKGIDQALAGPGQPSAAIKRAYAAGPQARVQAAKEKSLAAAKARPAIKMLDITEQPQAQDQGSYKRRRKLVGVPVTGSGATSGDGKAEEDASGTAEKDREGSPTLAEEDASTSASSSPTKTASFGSPNPTSDHNKSRQLSPEIPMPQPALPSAAVPPISAPDDAGVSAPPVEPASPTKATQPSSAPSSAPQVIHPQPGSLMDLSKLKITKETQKTIAEIFAKANRVTRPEKILIINFIAGARVNPCPDLGPVLTVRLSENLAPIILSDGHQMDGIVEEYFHMNFSTGEWKRLRKQKLLPAPGSEVFGAPLMPTPIPPVSTLTPTPSNSQMFHTGSPNMGFNQGGGMPQGNPGRSPF